MKNIVLVILLFATMISCDHRKELADAYGNFEVEDVIVSAEATGKLLSFSVEEGSAITTAKLLGIIDTSTVILQLRQMDAQISAVQSKVGSVKAQIASQQQQKTNVKVVVDRLNKLVENGAATQQQKDDAEGQMKLIETQIAASKTQIVSIGKEIEALKAQRELIKEQLKKCQIKSPVKGVVLEKYVKAGEMVVGGKPLFKVADLSTLDLRCYVSGDKLSSIKLGDKVKVLIDSGNGKTESLEGKIKWLSSQAEFTPKIIQTKEERVKLVYALKVAVQNDGRLKIGMPGEMNLIP